MVEALHEQPAFSEVFVAYLLARNVRYEEDLVDQLFDSSEKRLAPVLLILAHFGKEGIHETVVPKISQEILAEMIGATRSLLWHRTIQMQPRVLLKRWGCLLSVRFLMSSYPAWNGWPDK
jgi:hypothetical protein